MARVKWTADTADGVLYEIRRDGEVVEEDLTIDDLFHWLDGAVEPWRAHLIWVGAWTRWAHQ